MQAIAVRICKGLRRSCWPTVERILRSSGVELSCAGHIIVRIGVRAAFAHSTTDSFEFAVPPRRVSIKNILWQQHRTLCRTEHSGAGEPVRDDRTRFDPAAISNRGLLLLEAILQTRG